MCTLCTTTFLIAMAMSSATLPTVSPLLVFSLFLSAIMCLMRMSFAASVKLTSKLVFWNPFPLCVLRGLLSLCL